MHTLKERPERRDILTRVLRYYSVEPAFVKGCFLLTVATGFALLGLSACGVGGFKLINQIEARNLKSEILDKREICFEEFVNRDRFEACYEREMFELIAAECIEIRRTEPILQSDCENFLYRAVMKPDSFFEGDSVFPSPTDDPDKYRLDSLHAQDRAGGCNTSMQCRDTCRLLFTTRKYENYCYAYSAVAVSKMKAVFDVLEEATETGLDGLNTDENKRYLRIMLNIEPTDTTEGGESVLYRIDTDHSTEDVLESWSEEQQKRVLLWLAENLEIIRIFRASGFNSREPHFEVLEFVSDLDGSRQQRAESLSRSLAASSTGDGFIDKLIEEDNEVGLEWIHTYFEEDCDNADDATEKRCIFEDYYCDLRIQRSNYEDYLGYDFFTDTLDNVLKNQRKTSGAPSWWGEDTKSEDLESDGRGHLWDDVCDFLK